VMQRTVHAMVALAALALAACANHAFAPPGTASAPAVGTGLAPGLVAATLKLTGTYSGSIKEVEGSQERSGSVVIAIKQQKTKFSGSFTVKFGSKTADLTISGSVKSQGKGKAKLTFTIDDPKGRYAQGTATVHGKALNGKATVPPTSSNPGVTITFHTKKKGKHHKPEQDAHD